MRRNELVLFTVGMEECQRRVVVWICSVSFHITEGSKLSCSKSEGGADGCPGDNAN